MNNYLVSETNQTHIDPYGAGVFDSLAIVNYTAQSVYIMGPNGETTTLIPTLRSTHQVYNQYVIFKYIHRVGLQSNIRQDVDVYIDYTEQSINYPGYEIKIALTELRRGPVYVKELGFAVAVGSFQHQLGTVHRLGEEYTREAIIASHEKFVYEGSSTPFILKVNSHNPELEWFYFVLKNNIYSVKVKHDLQMPEKVLLHFHNGDDNNWYVDYRDIVASEVIDTLEDSFIIGYDREAVRKLMDQQREALRDKMTATEVDIKVKEAIREANRTLEANKKEIDQYKKTIDQLTRELNLLKKSNQLDDLTIQKSVSEATEELSANNKRLAQTNKLLTEDLKNTATELRQANTPALQSTEQFLAQQKTDTARFQLEAMAVKQEGERIRAQEKHLQDIRNLQMTFEQDKILNSLKLQKERESVYSAEISSYGTLAKTAAIIAPIVLSLGYMVFGRGAALIGGITSLMSGVTNLLSNLRMGTSMFTEIIGMVKNMFSPIASGICCGVKTILSKCHSVITHTANVIRNAASYVWNWITT